jgi:hypothetical protein
MTTGVYNFSTPLVYQQTSLTIINAGVTFQGDGRRVCSLKYTGTGGKAISCLGATNSAIASTGRLGLLEGVRFDKLGLIGTGKSTGDGSVGLYVQAYSGFEANDFLITAFGANGLWLDRLYYGQAPDATLDDRGCFSNLVNGEISFCGVAGLQAGGKTSTTDYSADHLLTSNMHFINSVIGARLYTQNYTDNMSLFHGDTIGVEMYEQNSVIKNSNSNFITSRFEGGQTDCMLKINSAVSAKFHTIVFLGRAANPTYTHVKIGSDAAQTVGYVQFDNCSHQYAGNAIDIVGTVSNVGFVEVKNPRFTVGITTKINNPNSVTAKMYEGNNITKLTGMGTPTVYDTVDGNDITHKRTGDANTWLITNNTGKTLTLGNGTAAADAAIKRLAISTAATAAIATSGPLAVQNTQAGIYSGTGTPEGVVTAAIGSMFMRTDGGAGTSHYIKESGTGNTGWIAK